MKIYLGLCLVIGLAVGLIAQPTNTYIITTPAQINGALSVNNTATSNLLCVDFTNNDTCIQRGTGAGFARLYSTTNSTTNTFAIKNGSNAEFGSIAWDGSNGFRIGTQGGTNGGTARTTIIGSASTLYLASNDGTTQFNVNTNGDLGSGSNANAVIINRATPTISVQFSSGTNSTIAGIASSFAITIGTTPGVTGTVAYTRAFGSVPSCQCTNTITANAVQCVPTTTTAVLNGVWVASDIIRCTSIGY